MSVCVWGRDSTVKVYVGSVSQYLMGKVALSICMHTRKGYSENWTVVMKSSDASVSKLTSTPALIKSRSTVTFPVITSAPLRPGVRDKKKKEAFGDFGTSVQENCGIPLMGWIHISSISLRKHLLLVWFVLLSQKIQMLARNTRGYAYLGKKHA